MCQECIRSVERKYLLLRDNIRVRIGSIHCQLGPCTLYNMCDNFGMSLLLRLRSRTKGRLYRICRRLERAANSN